MAIDLPEPVWIFPFEAMDIGDSFFIPTLKTAELIYILNTRAKAASVRIRSCVAVKDDCLGIRVWRVR